MSPAAPSSVAGVACPASVIASTKLHLSRHSCTASAGGSMVCTPAASSASTSIARNSSATVEIRARTPASDATATSSSANDGVVPGGIT